MFTLCFTFLHLLKIQYMNVIFCKHCKYLQSNLVYGAAYAYYKIIPSSRKIPKTSLYTVCNYWKLNKKKPILPMWIVCLRVFSSHLKIGNGIQLYNSLWRVDEFAIARLTTLLQPLCCVHCTFCVRFPLCRIQSTSITSGFEIYLGFIGGKKLSLVYLVREIYSPFQCLLPINLISFHIDFIKWLEGIMHKETSVKGSLYRIQLTQATF